MCIRDRAYVVSNINNEIILSHSLGSRTKAGGAELQHAMAAGVPVQGKVTGVNKGGFNVNILGHRAFCPMSAMDVKYFDDPMQYVSRTFPFVITRIAEGGRTIVVSRLPLLEKELEKKIEDIERAIGAKTVLSGVVSRIAEFGLFVDLGDIEGLIHISEVSWERVQNLADTFTPGQSVECVALKVERRVPLRDTRISLSIKQAGEDPWARVAEKLKPGDVVEGKVTRLANFGAFVQVLPGIEGLIHVSEMRWGRRVNHPSEVVSEGTLVTVSIVAVDEAKRSVSLSLKDVAGDPWNDIEQRFAAGSSAVGKVASRTRYGYFIDLADGITGLLPFANIAVDKKESLKPGETIDVTIESVDDERRRISLSLGVSPARREEQDAREFIANQKETKTQQSSEFGEMLKAALEKKAHR